MNTDVLIIGGGVIGLAIAREVLRAGESSVTLAEKSRCGTESSWAAAGILGAQAETDRADDFFELCRASRDLYPSLAAELLDTTRIDIELDRSGTLYLAFNEREADLLEKRLDWQRRAGLAVEALTDEETRREEPLVSQNLMSALLFPDDWRVDNRKLCAAFSRDIETMGGNIREHTTVSRLIVENDRVVGAETDSGPIHSDQTVLATGAWTSLIKLEAARLPIDIVPIRGQIVAFGPTVRRPKRVLYGPRGYLVPCRDGRILAGSTTESVGFDKSVTDDAADGLRAMATELLPGIADLGVIDHWAGLRPFATDGLPMLGPIAGLDGLVVATAHYRSGILLAPLTARLITGSLVSGSRPAEFHVFGPDRFRLATGAKRV